MYNIYQRRGKNSGCSIDLRWIIFYLFSPQRSMEIISSNCTRRGWSLLHLQACIRTDDSVSVDESQCVSIVRQVLDASPQVKHLVVESYCLPDYSSVYANLRSLHLLLVHPTCKGGDPFDLDRLVQLVPGIRRLETSARALMPDQKLVTFILDIITRFRRLVHLVINRESRYSSGAQKKQLFLQLFVATCEERGFDGSMIDVRFGIFDEINVWL